MQQQRRHTPYPMTWEIPVGILVVALAALVWGAHLGRGLATFFAGLGWTWPEYLEVARSIPGLLAGDAHAGLAPDILPRDASVPVLGWIIAVEVLILLGGFAAGVWAWGRWGPGRMLGMATPAQVEKVLGISRLRQNRHIIRPDLYPKK